MEIFQDLMKNYEKNISKGSLYNKNGRTDLALKFFNNALIDIYSANEFVQSNQDIKFLTKKDKNFLQWLETKIKSMNNIISKLEKYIEYLKRELYLEKTIKNIDSEKIQKQKSKNKRKEKNNQHNQKDKEDLKKNKFSFENHDVAKLAKLAKLDKYSEKDNFLNTTLKHDTLKHDNQNQNNKNWKEIAEKSMKLIYKLKSKYDFDDDYENDFVELVNKRRNIKFQDF